MLYCSGERAQPFFLSDTNCPEGLFSGWFIKILIEREQTVRTRITLACTECKQRNYNTTKDKKAHPERMETMKYCRFCRKHTLHKETK